MFTQPRFAVIAAVPSGLAAPEGLSGWTRIRIGSEREAARRMVTAPTGTSLHWLPSAIDAAVYLSGRLPFFLQILCHGVVEERASAGEPLVTRRRSTAPPSHLPTA